MRARMAYCGRLVGALAWAAGSGCGDAGPYPTVGISIEGDVTTAGPNPVAIPRATVVLREWLSGHVVAGTTTDQAGRYRLGYTFSSQCEPADETSDYVEAWAEGHEVARTFSTESGHFSDPPIYCTSEPQVIDLALRPFPTVVLSIQGRIHTGPDEVGVAGATVRLRHSTDERTLAVTTTDEGGRYQLSYSFASPCGPSEKTADYILATMEGYRPAMSVSLDDGAITFDQPIYCSSEPQVIDLPLQADTTE